jgi:hypothetical protein
VIVAENEREKERSRRRRDIADPEPLIHGSNPDDVAIIRRK